LEALTADDPRVIGDFRLQSRLGAGGMGRVYLGFSPAGRAVAVKVIHPHLARDPSFTARFRREVAAAQAVNAIYATPVVAAGPDDTPPWLATAFVPAPPLQDVVAQNGPLPEEAVWKLAAGLAEALRAVHASGLVHRDLKPGNVLMAADGPRLIDFGIARVMDGTRLTQTDGVVGTPSFMSPEQAQGAPVEGPSDVFSLGGVVCFAATGQAPFGSGIPAATLLYKIVFNQPQLDALPIQLRQMVAACLDKNPANRPTPAQLASALMPGLPGTDPSAPSRLSFWPEPVERFISDYRARLDSDGADTPFTPPPSNGWQLSGVPTAQGAPGGPTPPVPMIGDSTVRGARHTKGAGEPVLSRRRALAVLAGAVTAGAGIAGWEVSQHTGNGTPKLAAFTLPAVAPGKVAWKFDANASVSYAAQAGNRVYVATNGNKIFALSATTGKPVWEITSTTELNDSLGVAGGTVVVAGGNGPYGLSAATGKQLWSIKQEDSARLLMSGGSAYMGFAAKTNLTGGVTVLDPATGVLLWTYAFGQDDGVTGNLTVADGNVYAVTDNEDKSVLFVLSATSGGLRKRITGLGALAEGSLAASKGVLYAGLDDKQGTVIAVNTTTGKTLWKITLGDDAFPPYMAIESGLVFAGTVPRGNTAAGASLYALDPASGKTVWSQPVRAGVNEGPYATGGVVYTGGGIEGSTGILQAWQATTGKQLWEYNSPDSLGKITAYTGSRVYAGVGQTVYSIGA
jgi:serine/threonine protein kinase/outer membrane protein assembly factor BamB